MLKGFTDNGELKDVKVTENGEIKVAMEGSGGTQETVVTNTISNPVPVSVQNESTVIGNTSSNPVPVNVQNQPEEVIEEVKKCDIYTAIGIRQTFMIQDYITNIDIANYSDTSSIEIQLRDGNSNPIKTFTVGKNIATTLPINLEVASVAYKSLGADDTDFQLIVKGVMSSD